MDYKREALASAVFGDDFYQAMPSVLQLDAPGVDRPSVSVGLAPEVLEVALHQLPTRGGQPVAGAQWYHRLTYLVPLASVALARVRADYDKSGSGRREPRGYGHLQRLDLTLTFSDGWRLCELVINYRGTSADDEIEILAKANSVVQHLARHRLAAQSASLAAQDVAVLRSVADAATLQLPGPAKHKMSGKLRSAWEAWFPAASHFGVAGDKLPLQPVPSELSAPSDARGPLPLSFDEIGTTEQLFPRDPDDDKSTGQLLGELAGAHVDLARSAAREAPKEIGNLAAGFMRRLVIPLVVLVLGFLIAVAGSAQVGLGVMLLAPTLFFIRGRIKREFEGLHQDDEDYRFQLGDVFKLDAGDVLGLFVEQFLFSLGFWIGLASGLIALLLIGTAI